LLKHVHPNPAKPRSYNSKKTQDSKGFRLKPFGPVCVATQGVELDLKEKVSSAFPKLKKLIQPFL
jgi:hypothetical protein